jgi:hypothetical protein
LPGGIHRTADDKKPVAVSNRAAVPGRRVRQQPPRQNARFGPWGRPGRPCGRPPTRYRFADACRSATLMRAFR